MNFYIFFLITLISFSLVSCKKEPDLNLTVVNFENVDQQKIKYIKSVLENEFKIDSIKTASVKLPEEAYYKPRSRYRADKLIRYLHDNFEAEKVIGITDKDISTTSKGHKDWGIMGLAFRPGKSCVVSTFRTFRGAKSEKHKDERLKKVVLHEFGHTLGLPHCENSETCLMRDANGKVSTVDKVSDYCEKCKSKIRRYLKN